MPLSMFQPFYFTPILLIFFFFFFFAWHFLTQIPFVFLHITSPFARLVQRRLDQTQKLERTEKQRRADEELAAKREAEEREKEKGLRVWPFFQPPPPPPPFSVKT